MAFSANGGRWLLVGASPDLRSQILAAPALRPSALRNSPISDVLLLNAEVDGLAGLLSLRERHEFRLLAPAAVLAEIEDSALFNVLDRSSVSRHAVGPGQAVEAAGALRVTLIELPGKVPLFREVGRSFQPGNTYAARVESSGKRFVIAPACAEVTPELQQELLGADVVFFDGTLFTDNEMITAGLGTKTGRRMGHVPICGEEGSLARLADIPGRRIYIHLNNSNPVLIETSSERLHVEAAGFEIAYDGMELAI